MLKENSKRKKEKKMRRRTKVGMKMKNMEVISSKLSFLD